MFIARWLAFTCFALVGTSPRLLTAQSSADASRAPVHLPSVGLWGSFGLGNGQLARSSTSQFTAIGKVNLSVGPAMLSFRTSDIGPFIAAGDGVRDNGLLGGVRTGWRHLFGSAALGFANASHYHECDQCGVTDVSPSVGVMVYDVTAHANLFVLGVAASFSGIVGPERVRYSAFTVGLEAGWFGR
jgi:hypothetical protein